MRVAGLAPSGRTLAPMRIDEERIGQVVVLIPGGDMDLNTLPDFEARLAALQAEGVKALLWDLERVAVLPSAAIGFLIQSVRRIKESGGYMAIACASRLVKSTLDTMGVLQIFALHETREEGVSALTTRLSE